MLYICPTPIGNLEDVTLRVLSVLRSAALIACEDTRHTRILLDRYGIAAKTVSFHEHNEEQRLLTLLPLLREGRGVAVVSNAGMPGISDPGFTLVRACAAEGLPVTVLPGASAVLTALVAAALPADRFAFVGFLSRGRKKLIEQIAAFDDTGATVVALESPRRLRATLEAVGSRWPDRRLAVCRELTKIHEEVLRGTAAELSEALVDPVRGEIVLVLEPSTRAQTSGIGAAGPTRHVRPGAPAGGARSVHAGRRVEDSDISVEHRARTALGELLRMGLGTKQAAAVVAGLTGLPKRRAYELALDERAGQKGERTGLAANNLSE